MSEQLHSEYNYVGKLPEGMRDQGFKVETLNSRGAPLPVDQVLATYEERKQDILNRLTAGDDIRLLHDGESEAEDEVKILPYVEVKIPTLEYEHKITQGAIIPSGRNGIYSMAHITASQASRLGISGTFPEIEKEALQQFAVDRAASFYDVDYMGIPEDIAKSVNVVSQVFELTSRDKEVRLFNFTETLISDQQLQKIINALRHSEDMSGGTTMKKLSTIAIIPKECPYWGALPEEATERGGAMRTGVTRGRRAIMVNEELLLPPKNEDKPGKVENYVVGEGDLEATIYHELMHVASNDTAEVAFGKSVGWEVPVNDFGSIDKGQKQHFHGDFDSPSVYGGIEVGEDVPETATAQYMGSEWDDRLSSNRKSAMAELWVSVRSDQEGPAYVKCNEVDITKLPRKVGLSLQAKLAIRPEFFYRVVPGDQ